MPVGHDFCTSWVKLGGFRGNAFEAPCGLAQMDHTCRACTSRTDQLPGGVGISRLDIHKPIMACVHHACVCVCDKIGESRSDFGTTSRRNMPQTTETGDPCSKRSDSYTAQAPARLSRGGRGTLGCASSWFSCKSTKPLLAPLGRRVKRPSASFPILFAPCHFNYVLLQMNTGSHPST